MIFLRQSTASQSVKLGPFLDETDGKTPEFALTIANTDIKLAKAGAAFANKNSGGGTHDAQGWYTVTFDATDTATVGMLRVSVQVAGALPVFHDCYVFEEAIFDALFATGATGLLPATINSLSAQAKSEVRTEAAAALTTYDAPTKAEMDAAFAALQTHGDTSWLTATGFAVAGDAMTLTSGERSTLAGQLDLALINAADGADLISAIANAIAQDWISGDASPLAIVAAIKADAEWVSLIADATAAKTAAQSGDGKLTTARLAKIDNLLATGTYSTLDSTAVQTAAQTGATAALTTYDPPTRDEATTDKTAILTAIGQISGGSGGGSPPITPLSGVIVNRASKTNFAIYSNELRPVSVAVVSRNKEPFQLDGRTLRVVIETAGGTPLAVLTGNALSVTANDPTNNPAMLDKLTFTPPVVVVDKPTELQWALWDDSDGFRVLLLEGNPTAYPAADALTMPD